MKNTDNDKLKIVRGLKFKSITFMADAEVAEVRLDLNEVDVMITTSEGFSHIEKSWNLQELEGYFEKKIYTVKEVDRSGFGVW